jgi:hypothetical protein
MRQAATVQPARLALGLRAALLEDGIAIHEGTRARRLRAGGSRAVVVETDTGGRVVAPTAVVAINAAAAGFGPLRNRLAVTSTHMLVTEPAPDLLEEIGWTGGECISTARTYLHYFRTTPDGRIAFGWGGGRVAYGARLGGRIEADDRVAERVRAGLLELFPGLRGRRIAAAWGGPVDVSPNRPRAPRRQDPRRAGARRQGRADRPGVGRAGRLTGPARADPLHRRRAGPGRADQQGGPRGRRAHSDCAERAPGRAAAPPRSPHRAVAAARGVAFGPGARVVGDVVEAVRGWSARRGQPNVPECSL